MINNGPPSGYIVDDGAILSRASKSDINKELNRLEVRSLAKGEAAFARLWLWSDASLSPRGFAAKDGVSRLRCYR